VYWTLFFEEFKRTPFTDEIKSKSDLNHDLRIVFCGCVRSGRNLAIAGDADRADVNQMFLQPFL
jgi:hypothetical protein